ncbi:60S ribosomal protein L10A [Coemansia sp. RSA 486]|nr:60S ribosomal protein L10A [Coemansia sp. RSA 486]
MYKVDLASAVIGVINATDVFVAAEGLGFCVSEPDNTGRMLLSRRMLKQSMPAPKALAGSNQPSTSVSERDVLDGLLGSKIQVAAVREEVKAILAASNEKKRNFVETIELQIGLKNYDPQRDKRFSGTIKLPSIPRPKMSVAILGDAHDCDKAKGIDMPFRSAEDLKKLNMN